MWAKFWWGSGNILALCLASEVSAQVNVLTYHNDNARTGGNPLESLVTPVNVKTNTFGKLFTYAVDGHVYAQPLYVSGLVLPGGARNVLFVATQHNTVYALDADHHASANAGVIWQTNLGPSASTPTFDFGTRYAEYAGIVPEVGITGTPVIDLSSGTLFVDTFIHVGANYLHRLHALSITNGSERPFSPVTISASVPGSGVDSTNGVVSFTAKQQLQRSALTLAGGRIYVAYASYSDTNPYHGWVLGFDAATLQLPTNYIFNATPNSTVQVFGPDAGEAGIWMSGCGLAADNLGNLFLATGNGSFNALNNSGETEFGDTFLKLSAARGLTVADYFTPYNQAFLSSNDLDLGSGGVMLLPNQPGPFPHLMISAGKQGVLYLLNRDQLTAGNNHFNASGTGDAVVQTAAVGGGVYDTPAWFNGTIYYAASQDVLAGFSISNGVLSFVSSGTRTFAYPGATPSVSANGTNHALLWAVQMGSPATLIAWDPAHLSTELYASDQAPGARDQLTNGIKFAVPTIANGKVYVGGRYAVTAFGLLASPWDQWMSRHFGTNNIANAVGDDERADPDGDGVPNVFEYSFATDPNIPDAQFRPAGSITNGQFRFHFRRNIFASDVTYVVQSAVTPAGPWTNVCSYTAPTGWTLISPAVTMNEGTVTGSAPDEAIDVLLTESNTAPIKFYRLTVQRAP